MQRILSKMAVLLALLVASGLSGCTLLGGPDLHRLDLVSIDAANLSNSSDSASSRKGPIDELPLLVVNFTAERDLNEYATRYEYNIGNTASFCLQRKMDGSRLLQGDPYVFDAEGMIDAYRKGNAAGRPAAPGTAIYKIYIAVRSVPLAGQDVFNYDLARDPVDVCIQLRGGNMLGDRFVSNVIVIPKAALANALRPH